MSDIERLKEILSSIGQPVPTTAPGRRLSGRELKEVFDATPNLATAIRTARGETPGAEPPAALRGRPNSDLSQIDRYEDVRATPLPAAALYATVLGPAWELYKAKALEPATPERLISDLLSLDSVPPELQQFSVSHTRGKTSAPSLGNLTAPVHGLIDSLKEKLGKKKETQSPGAALLSHARVR